MTFVVFFVEVWEVAETLRRRGVRPAARRVLRDVRRLPHGFFRRQTGQQEHGQTQGGGGETGAHRGTGSMTDDFKGICVVHA